MCKLANWHAYAVVIMIIRLLDVSSFPYLHLEARLKRSKPGWKQYRRKLEALTVQPLSHLQILAATNTDYIFKVMNSSQVFVTQIRFEPVSLTSPAI